ncbi:MAG: pentapeptide repeat-containing protein [Nitrospirota bacterium]
MANTAHVTKFYEGVEAWNSWRERHPLVTPDLTEANLQGLNLMRANLQQANLRGVDLREANLKQANLVGINLEGADLLRANLKGADLRQANLSGANLVGARLKGATVREAMLEGVVLREANLKGADLLGARLQGANLWAANLKGANLWAANLKGAYLREANLKEAGLREANLAGADLAQVNIKGRMFRRRQTTLYGANFNETHVQGIKCNRWARYQGIRLDGSHGSAWFRRFARDQDFIEEFRSSRLRFPLYVIWLLFTDCGRSLSLGLSWAIVVALLFASRFYALGEAAFSRTGLPWSFGATVYHSVVTLTTLGFGNLKPLTMEAAWWVMAEVMIGYLMLAGLIAILFGKLARRG